MSAESLEIIRNLAQAAATSYDGALDENGEPMSLGLKREEGHPVHDSRTVDGFKIRFQGPQMIVTYQSDIKLKEIYKGNFENEIESTFADIVKWLKREYRKVDNILNITNTSEIFLIQEIADERYELLFGDGIFGKKIENDALITVAYIVTDGVEGNGPSSFTYAGSVASSSNQIQLPSTTPIITTAIAASNGGNI